MVGWEVAILVSVRTDSTLPQQKMNSMAAWWRFVDSSDLWYPNIFYINTQAINIFRLPTLTRICRVRPLTTCCTCVCRVHPAVTRVLMKHHAWPNIIGPSGQIQRENLWKIVQIFQCRLILLGISVFCAISSPVLIILVINYRKMKVFKYSSPTFLSLTLIGCGIMYR